MIGKGETASVEFKVAAYWNAYTRKKDETMKEKIVQAVAAFLNSKTGGTVLIGVDDKGNVVGLADDYLAANPQKRNRDGYELALLEDLANNLSENWNLFSQVTFGNCQGKEICMLTIAPASGPIYLKNGDFYVRKGARKRKYPVKDAMAYIRERWKL